MSMIVYTLFVSEVEFRGTYQFHSSRLKPWQKFTLKCVDFTANIAFSANQCFLTNRTLYLLVWDVSKEPSELIPWLDCLASLSLSDSHIMIFGNGKNCIKNKMEIEKELAGKAYDLIKSYENFQKLRFGAWKEDSKFGDYWFNYFDLSKPKGI